MLNRGDDLRSLGATLPEEVLSAKFLEPFGITPDELAERLGVSIQVAYEIIVGTRIIDQEMAGRLASVFRTFPPVVDDDRSAGSRPKPYLNLQVAGLLLIEEIADRRNLHLTGREPQ